MTRAFAASMVTLVAFFATLGLLAALGMWSPAPNAAANRDAGAQALHGAPVLGPTATAPTHLAETDAPPPLDDQAAGVEPAAREPDAQVVDVRWSDVVRDDGAPQLSVIVRASNPTFDDLRITAGTARLAATGWTADAETPSWELPLLAGTTLDVVFDIPLQGDDAAGWFATYMQAGEAETVSITGTLVMRDAAGAGLDVRFDWEDSWTGTYLADIVGQQDCETTTQACLVVMDASWQDAGPALRFATAGLGHDKLIDVAVTLQFGTQGTQDVAVAHIDALVDGQEVLLEQDAAALAAWWPGHAADCETSPSFLVVEGWRVSRSGDGPSDGTFVSWSITLPELRTSMACDEAS